MDVDGSFAEYVAARWSMLYRLAALLAGESEADELTQEALVRAYLSWRDIQESAQADVLVERILAAIAVHRPPRAAPDDERPPLTGRSSLWDEVGRLLPRQRAVLVLRHYEGFTDAEIAEALGCATGEVAADSLALETGIDVADLRAELDRRSYEVDVPLPPIGSLLTQGHRARRERVRRSLTWTAGVAAVVVLALALANVLQDRAPRRAHPGAATPSAVTIPSFLRMLPNGDPPRIAYTVRRSLHLVSGQVVALPSAASSLVQTQEWLFVAALSGAVVRVDPETAESQVVVGGSGGEVVTDPGGVHVAWLAAGTGPAVVVVQSVDPEGVLLSDRQEFPARPRCCDNPFVVNGMTQDGTVIASLPAASKAWAWYTPDAGATQVQEIAGLGNGVITQVTAEGIVVHYPPFQFAYGTLEGGIFLQHNELAARQADFADPLGRRIVYADSEGEILVREREIRGRSRRFAQSVRLRLPALDQGYTAVRWEDSDHVLLDVSDASRPDGVLVRCQVVTGDCETAATLDGPHLLAR